MTEKGIWGNSEGFKEIKAIISRDLDKAIELIGGISCFNTKDNRKRLYKGYDLLLNVQKYI